MLTGLVLFLLLLVVVLAIPVTLMFQVSRRQAFSGDITLKWAFGLISGRLPLVGKVSSSAQSTQPPRKTAQRQRRSREPGRPLALLGYRPFRRRIVRFVSALWHAVEKRDLTLRLRLGLGDPADTGQLWAILGPLAGVLATSEQARLEIEAEFMEEVFELDGSGTLRFIPLHIIYLALALLFSPALWSGLRKMHRA